MSGQINVLKKVESSLQHMSNSSNLKTVRWRTLKENVEQDMRNLKAVFVSLEEDMKDNQVDLLSSYWYQALNMEKNAHVRDSMVVVLLTLIQHLS